MKTLAALGAAALLAAPPLAPPELTPAAESAAATREGAPVTDHCPNSLTPPEPMTTSEALAPGQPTPTPPPVAVEGDCGVSHVRGYRVPEGLTASAWVVADIDSGEIIAQKDPHGRYRPASIIKVLLAMVAINELPLDRVHVASAETTAQEGSSVGIGAGGEYTVEQLLQGLLMGSGNDAAHALAQELGGDETTLARINDYAAGIGATDTHAATYSGLDAPGMMTSAHDMALAYREAFTNPVFARIVNTESVPFPGYGDVPGYELGNDNGLFMNDPDGIGGKTGYTDDANHTFVGALDRDGRRLMAVILDATIEGGPPWEQAQQLVHAAYEVPAGRSIGTLTPVAAISSTAPAPVVAPPSESTGVGRGAGVAITLLVIAVLVMVGAIVALTRRR